MIRTITRVFIVLALAGWQIPALFSVSSTQVQQELENQLQARASMPSDLFSTLYKWHYHYHCRSLCISKEKLAAGGSSPNQLKELFEKSGLTSRCIICRCKSQPFQLWTNENWQKACELLTKRAEGKEKEFSKVYIEEIPQLLQDTQAIVKSFLPQQGFVPDPKKFIIKRANALGRLLTYAQLQRAIQENKLSHVHLPLKVLLIQDVNTGKYLDSKTASKILDTMVKISVSCCVNGLEANLYEYDKNYEMHIVAHKQVDHFNSGFNRAARTELETLVEKSPFDVGYANIFAKSNGDAVIIDTEYKGEPAETAKPKLKRYR